MLLALLGGGALLMAFIGGHWSSVGLGGIAFFLFLIIGTGILPHTLAGQLQRSFSIRRPAEVRFGRSVWIVLLGEGTTFDPGTRDRVPSWIAGSRISSAVALHKAAIASESKSRIIIAGEWTRASQSGAPSSYASALVDLGVAQADVMHENQGLNTYAHAKNISEMLKSNPAETAFLVTSALHMKRALLYFEAFGIRPEPFPSDYINVPRQIIPVGYNFAVADIALHQYIGILRFHVYESLGLNRRVPPVQGD